jgi:hypothetical protein
LRKVLDGVWREEILLKWENYWDARESRLKRDEEDMAFTEKERERFIDKASVCL